MPYGPRVPHMFIVIFVIMLPIYLATKDPFEAWEAGLAWCFIIGLHRADRRVRRPVHPPYTPRAALLGTLAGISIAFISMRPAAQMWEALWIALPVLAIILIGFFTDLKLPGNIPVGLAALLVGTAIGWIGGYMSAPDVTAAAKDIAVALPTAQLRPARPRPADVAPLLATAIPLGIYNFTEGMTNVESAAAAGDNYNLRSVLLADGTGAVVGSALGSPVPARRLHRAPGLEGGRRPHRLLDGSRRRHRAALLPRPVRAARRAAAAAGDRADPALHRPADRRAGVPGGAASGTRSPSSSRSSRTSPPGRRARSTTC